MKFQADGRTWTYKDVPRQLQPGEWYVETTKPLGVGRWPKDMPRPTEGVYVPVEPVEPEEVTVTLRTAQFRNVVRDTEAMGDVMIADGIRDQMRTQGVDV